METKFTKGEWTREGLGMVTCQPPQIGEVKPKHKLIASVYPLPEENFSELIANQNLIAAAPDLLLALMELTDAYIESIETETSKDANVVSEIINARAAIKKATE